MRSSKTKSGFSFLAKVKPVSPSRAEITSKPSDFKISPNVF
jgi:hypothetical protein